MTHINLRRDTAANWTASNPVLQLGETGWERDTRRVKLGDGVTAWVDLDYIIEPGVDSVNGQTGTVVLDKSDIGLGSVDNTPDTGKPVSAAQAAALATKAPLASPAFTGNPTAPTASPGDADSTIATTAFVDGAVADFADAVVAVTNKDLTDPSNEFPPTLVTLPIWGDMGSEEGPFTSEALLTMVPINLVALGVYRVTLYCECSNADATEYTIIRLKLDSVSSGTTGTEFAEGLTDHRSANRRVSMPVFGIFTSGVTGLRYVKATCEGSGSGSTIRGGSTPTLLMVERIG